ncbi:MAG: peptide chain release factor N(5)-glutamine methyltransferase [Candidatus Paceibacterota bacterium]
MKKDFKKEIEWIKKDKYPDEPSEVRLRAHLKSDFARLGKGEPIDYIIGWKEFLGCKIDLSEKPLIPREETEFWVGEAIKEIPKDSPLGPSQGKSFGIRALDIFAGSGCIGLAVLNHCPELKMTFADKEEKCIKQIKKNLKLNKLRGKVIQSDLFKGLGKFDIIFANPPYIPTKKSKVQKSVKNWEPKEALWAGADGLLIIKKFFKEAKGHLNPNGKIYLEFGYGQKKAIEDLLKQKGYKSWEFKKDQFGRFRVAKIIGG